MGVEERDEGGTQRRGSLIAFVVLVGLLFATYRWHAPVDARRIVLTHSQIEARIRAEEELRGARPSPQDQRDIVAQMVEDAVLLREAERRQLDRDDALIRRTLLGGMWTELGGDAPMPTEEEAKEHFASNSRQYSTPSTVSIIQAVFAIGADAPPPGEVLTALETGTAPEAFGTVFRVPSRTTNLTRSELVAVYGASFADAVLAIDDDEWHGPIPSTLAVHYVRVTERRPSRPRAYEEVSSYVREDVHRERMQEALQERMPEIRARYDVLIEGAPR